jgi:hypothetical protein
MLERVLAFAGYIPAEEKAAAVKLCNESLVALSEMTIARDGLKVSLREMTIARDELARRMATAFDEVGAAVSRCARLQTEIDLVYGQHQELVLKYEALVIESRWKDGTIGELTQTIDEQNATIAEMQRQRPQLVLVRPESENRAPTTASEDHAEDEVIVPEHTVEMSGRLIIVALEGKTFWTLSVNDHQFKVAIHDHTFLDEGQLVGKGTVIRAEFLETTFRRRSDGEPYTTRSLERVLEVIPPTPATTQPMFVDAAAIHASSGRS